MLILCAGLLPSLLIHAFLKLGRSKRRLRSTVAAICFARGSLAVCTTAVIAPIVLVKARFGIDVLPEDGFWVVTASTGLVCLLAVTFAGLALAGMHRVRAVYGLIGALGFWAMPVVAFNAATRLVVDGKPSTSATGPSAAHAAETPGK